MAACPNFAPAGLLTGDALIELELWSRLCSRIPLRIIPCGFRRCRLPQRRPARRGSRVELMAENPDYAPIAVNGPLAIEGLVVGLIRGGRAL